MAKTNIEWTDETWNPQTGCRPDFKCWDHCWARRMAHRLANNPSLPDATRAKYKDFKPAFHPERLAQPLSWRKPRSCFIDSMGDIALGTPEQIAATLGVVAACPESRFQLLTKRPGLLLEAMTVDVRQYKSMPCYCIGWAFNEGVFEFKDIPENPASIPWSLPNLAIGVSVSNQKDADERIPLLLRIPARWRFVSAEPLLGSLDLNAWLDVRGPPGPPYIADTPRLDGVIVGGETGYDARPCHPDWVRGIRDQCADAGVAFHFKSWGEYRAQPWVQRREGDLIVDGTAYRRVGKKRSRRMLDGRTHDELCWMGGES